ncbi:hypothetical protein J2T08_000528 [Neorhizobium galegae]|uniref:hypothetical protein n=1 Tax=Neorhizobium galegae TaxID=399 RepID=UPI00277EDDF5|nr:hypothetical protein [Neorhizobium galegae]MDQ0132627.1 hypothetical protein [Neorhizobium galegae]
MTHYSTCTNCAVDKDMCPRRENLRKALKGSAVYSLKFKCPDRLPMFQPGQRVGFDWSLWDADDYDSSELPLTFSGTVLRERGTKFVIQVDSGPDTSGEGIQASDVFKKNDALLTKVRPAKMTALDEPARKVCLTCYHVEGQAEDRCYKSGTSWVPNGCIEPDVSPKRDVNDDEVVF